MNKNRKSLLVSKHNHIRPLVSQLAIENDKILANLNHLADIDYLLSSIKSMKSCANILQGQIDSFEELARNIKDKMNNV